MTCSPAFPLGTGASTVADEFGPMTSSRRILIATLVALAVVVGPAAPAVAADYRSVVDITFPARGPIRYSNDFANPRSGGRVHRATDLFGAMGTRMVAARTGTVIWLPTSEVGLSGFAMQILGDDGRTYAYYHLGPAGGRLRQAVARGINLGSRVTRGQLVGYLGNSGNAAGGAPHVHFEIHDNRVKDPYGSNRINPYASLRAAQGLSAGVSGPAPTVSPGSDALRLGANGPAVKRWQRRLNRTRTTGRLVVDGVFGPGTHAATVTFQKSVGLGPGGLGTVGPRTRAAMSRRLANLSPSRPTPPKPPRPTPPSTRRPTPPASTSSGSTLLRLGDNNADVAKWQRQLNRSGRTKRVSTDGAFGPATQAATVTFQKSVGLGPTGLGVVGPKTRAAMRRVLR